MAEIKPQYLSVLAQQADSRNPDGPNAHIPRTGFAVVPAPPPVAPPVETAGAEQPAGIKLQTERKIEPAAELLDDPLKKAQKEFEKAKAEYAERLKTSEHHVKVAEVGIGGSEKQITLDKAEIHQPWWRTALGAVFIPLMAYDIENIGTNSQIKKGIASEEKLLDAKRTQLVEIKANHGKALELGDQFAVYEAAAKKLIEDGHGEDARAMLELSAAALKKASSVVGTKKALVTTEEHSKNLSEISQSLEDHVRHIGYAETTVRTVRNSAIAAGVVIGTAGVGTGALAVGGGITATGWTAGITLTTLGTTAAAGAGNLTEAIGHVSWGNKDAGTAFSEAGAATLRDGRDNLIGSVSTAIGFRAGGLVTGVVQRGMTTAAVRSVVNSGSHAAVDTYVAEKFEWPTIEEQLTSKVTEDELNDIHQRWKQSRGLTVQQLVRNGLIDVGVSTILGGSGAQASALTQTMSTGARLTTVASVDSLLGTAVGTGSGMLKAKLDGREFTTDDFIREASGSIASSVAGSLSQAFPNKRDDSGPTRSKGPNTPDDDGSSGPNKVVSALNGSPLEMLKQMFFRRPAVFPAAGSTEAAGGEKNGGQPVDQTVAKTAGQKAAPSDSQKTDQVAKRDQDGGAARDGQADPAKDAAKDGQKANLPQPKSGDTADGKQAGKSDPKPAGDQNQPKTTPPDASAVNESLRDKVGRFFDNMRIRTINTLSETDEQRPLRGPGDTELDSQTLAGFYKEKAAAWRSWKSGPLLRYTISDGSSLLTQRKGLPMDRDTDGKPIPLDPEKVIWVGATVHRQVNTVIDAIKSVPGGTIFGRPVIYGLNLIKHFNPLDFKRIPDSAWQNGRPDSAWLKSRDNWNPNATHPGAVPPIVPSPAAGKADRPASQSSNRPQGTVKK